MQCNHVIFFLAICSDLHLDIKLLDQMLEMSSTTSEFVVLTKDTAEYLSMSTRHLTFFFAGGV